MTSQSPNSIAVKGISDRESVETMQELGDSLAVKFSCEMDVLYDPLNLNFESRIRVTSQNEANTLNTEYGLPSPSQLVSDAQIL